MIALQPVAPAYQWFSGALKEPGALVSVVKVMIWFGIDGVWWKS
jgi:hypothetical protein